jgi:hypothetical protein
MTRKEAKELTLELWRYLAEHPECYQKDMVPQDIYDKVKALESKCPLCEVFNKPPNYCVSCPLYKADEWCLNDGSAWYRWFRSAFDNPGERKEAANQIVKIVSAWEPEDE